MISERLAIGNRNGLIFEIILIMHKKTIYSLLVTMAVLVMNLDLSAQKKFTNGSISFKVIQVDGPEYLKSFIRGGRSTIHIKEDMMNTELYMMNGMVQSEVITNNQTDTSFMLNDMMGDKTAVLLDDVTPEDGIKISYDKKDKKEIVGYTCHKVSIKFKGGKIDMYVTDDIKAPNQLFRAYPGLKGFPLEYDMAKNGVTLTFQASTISHIVPEDTKFLIPDDYKRMTMKEFEAMMKGKSGM